MDEKSMVNDVLDGVKTQISDYQKVITETENVELRNTIQQIRNTSESFQYELFKIAQAKGYYTSPETATPEQINKVKNELDK